MKVSLVAPKDFSQHETKIWQRDMFMIVRPIIVVTTKSKEGVPNAALKTNFMNVSVLEKVAFGCYPGHDTHRNIIETEEFVINIPPHEIIDKIMVTAVDFPHNVNEIEKAELTAIPSEKVRPPRIKECKLHLECRLAWRKDSIIIGNVVAASADDDLLDCTVEERQMRLTQVFLVGAKMYGKVGETKELPIRIIEQYEKEQIEK